jgi:hypothetical protein
MANNMVSLDANQVIRSSVIELESGEFATRTAVVGGNLVPNEYDQITLTYVPSGNGVGEIQTATYKYQGNTVAVLTLSYDSSHRLIDTIRS